MTPTVAVVWVITVYSLTHQPIGTFASQFADYGTCELARATPQFAVNFPNWTKCLPIGARQQGTYYHRRGG